jgi:RimJ/RimL family protein N-acetyltransferase
VPFDLQPHLTGNLIQLRPLRTEDWNDLFAVASDPLIWKLHPARDRYQEPVFREFFREALASGGAFAILDAQTKAIIGSSRYFGYDQEKSEVEIGWTFIARRYWGGIHNAELKRLMLDHAFQYVDNVVFFVGEHNLRSRRAMEKIGGVLDGMVEKQLPSGPINSVRYVIKKQDWFKKEQHHAR